MSLDVNQLRTYWESELQRIGALPNSYVTQPNQHKLPEITNASNSSEKLNSKQSLTEGLEDKEILLLNLFREFTKKDEGKVLAAELGKFARFVQSDIAKASKQ